MDESSQTGSDVDEDEDEETLLLNAINSGKYAFLKLLDTDARIGEHAHMHTDVDAEDHHVIGALSEAVSQQVAPLVEAHTLKSVPMDDAVTEALDEFGLPSREWLEELSKEAQARDGMLTEDSCSEALLRVHLWTRGSTRCGHQRANCSRVRGSSKPSQTPARKRCLTSVRKRR